MVSKVNESSAKSSSAYVLFYIRKDLDSPPSSSSITTNATTTTPSTSTTPFIDEDTDSEHEHAEPMETQDDSTQRMEDITNL